MTPITADVRQTLIYECRQSAAELKQLLDCAYNAHTPRAVAAVARELAEIGAALQCWPKRSSRRRMNFRFRSASTAPCSSSPARSACTPEPPETLMTIAELNRLFTYHPPTRDQIPRYQAIRDAARQFAGTIVLHTPPGADCSAAIRKVREAMMTANAGIACHDPNDSAGP